MISGPLDTSHNFIAFDVAGSTGWASYIEGGFEYGSYQIASKLTDKTLVKRRSKKTKGRKIAVRDNRNYVDWTRVADFRDFVNKVYLPNPGHVIVESPFHRGSNTRYLNCLWGVVGEWANLNGHYLWEYANSEWKASIVGSGSADKEQISEFARGIGIDSRAQDEDDACLLLLHHLKSVGIDWGPLSDHLRAQNASLEQRRTEKTQER